MSVLYLPRAFNLNLGIPQIRQWVTMPEEGPDELASKLSIPEQLIESQIIGAIPTPWARLLIFEQALFNTKHPLHTSILSEWRGLLACFCFSSHIGFEITYDQINLSNLRQNISESKVSYSFKQTKPTGTSDTDTLWDRFDLIRVNNYVIGAVSPRTIVFTTAEKLKKLPIPWYKNGRFLDPKVYFKEIEDLRILSAWIIKAIDNLQINLSAIPNIGRIVQLFQKWQNEIEIDPVENLSFNSFGNPPLSLIPITIQDGIDIESDVILKPTKKIDKPPLLVSESILKDDSRRIYKGIRGNETLVKRLPTGIKGDKFSDSIPYPWLNPDKLFTDVLIQITTINEKNAYCLKPQHSDKTFLFPFKKEILDYFNSDELSGRVSIKNLSSRDIQIILRLPTTSGKKDEEFSRVYSNPVDFLNIYQKPAENTIVNIDTPPVIELYPNFVHENWDKYFVFLAMQVNEQHGETLHFVVFPTDPDPFIRKKGLQTQVYEKEFIWLSENFPEALIFDFFGAAGILPIKKPSILTPHLPKSAYNVAVDFGESNTTVFWAPENAELGSLCNRVEFQARNIPLTSVDEITRDSILRSGFLPQADIKTCLDTSIITYPNPPIGDNGIKDGVIYLPDVFREIHRESEQGYISAGLKWADDVGEKDKVTIYLEQLLTMIEAEAFSINRAIIKYKWAFPQSFNLEMINKFNDRWNTIISKIGKISREKKPSSASITESMAICQYLKGTKEDAVIEGNSLFGIDIGGSTTDIGVWSKNQMVIRDSFRLAGWTLSHLLTRNKEIGATLARILRNRLNQDVGNMIFSGDDSQISMYWNRLLRYLYETKLFDRFVGEIRASRDKNCSAMTTVAITTAALTVFYSGIRAGSWHEIKKEPLPGNQPRLFFTGNGGNLLLWLTGGKGNYNPFFGEIFKEGYLVSAKSLNLKDYIYDSIYIEEPSQPKDEVAIGLLLNDDNLKESFENHTIAGDAGLQYDNGNPIEPFVQLNDQQFANLIVPRGWNSESLIVFVNTFNKMNQKLGLGLKELPGPERLVAIGDDVRERVARANNDFKISGKGVKLESPFAIAAESYIRRAINEKLL